MHVFSAGATMKSVVPQGYKQTEVGLIPEDWLEHTIGELIEFEGGSQPDKSYFRASWKHGYVRLIQIRDYKTDMYERLVWSFIVVVVEVGLDSVFCFLNGFVIFEVDFLILQRPPEPFHKDIVNCSSFAVHADKDTGIFQNFGMARACEL